jgi:Fe2+ or Zn2+ uptake regulation protein/O6-methylguanine-DNA--protein-cysteine methyltransferase
MSAIRPQPDEQDPGAILRARGLRVTPQRRAILGAFTGAATEHLSADEVHARASASVPELSRGTVYATLAELAELGLLAALGTAEPVRYELHAAEHQHFRCRLCLRVSDVDLPPVATDAVSARGFVVERATVTVEGICADCVSYGAGLETGVQHAHGDPGQLPTRLARARMESPVGELLLAATPDGLIRLVFGDHADAPALRATRRTGSAAARRHLADAQAYVEAYVAGDPPPPACQVDWASLDNVSVPTLQAVQAIEPGTDRSYEALRSDAGPYDRGLALGTNPLALVVPCHRVTRGREITEAYIGGAERKRALRSHER